jgi:hypothetical protein
MPPFPRPFIGTILWSVVLATIATGCKPADRAVRADLTLYLQRTADWAPVEAETARTIERVLATQFVDDAEVRRQVTADAPRVEAHLARIEAVQPASAEVRDIHRRYVDNWRRLAAGYRDLLHGVSTGDVPEIASGRKALQAWRAGILETARELRRLQADLGT